MQLVAKEQIPWLRELNGRRVFLLKFPRIDVPHGSDNLVQWLRQQNVLPLIVHPERNRTFLDHLKRLQPFINVGCPLQLTASSLTGKFGADVQKMAFHLLEEDNVFAIVADCHNLKGRAPDLGTTIEGLAKSNEASLNVNALVNEHPARLLRVNC